MLCAGSVPDLSEGWRDGEDMISFLSDITAYGGYGYGNDSLPQSCQEEEEKPGHHTVAHGGLGD